MAILDIIGIGFVIGEVAGAFGDLLFFDVFPVLVKHFCLFFVFTSLHTSGGLTKTAFFGPKSLLGFADPLDVVSSPRCGRRSWLTLGHFNSSFSTYACFFRAHVWPQHVAGGGASGLVPR